jgi:hypothetical protein
MLREINFLEFRSAIAIKENNNETNPKKKKKKKKLASEQFLCTCNFVSSFTC